MDKYKVEELVDLIDRAEMENKDLNWSDFDPRASQSLRYIVKALKLIKSELMKGDKNG
jgi:hypothetical protein